MPANTTSESAKRRRAQEIAAMMAVAVIPRTFQRSLLPRSTVDQGIITGVTVVFVYMLGQLTEDAIETTSRLLTEKDNEDQTSSSSTALVSAVALGLGILSQKYNEYSPDEMLPKSTARTVGKWVGYAGLAGLIIESVEAINKVVSKDEKTANERDLLPYFVGAGLVYTMTEEYLRAKKRPDFSLVETLKEAKPARVIGISAGAVALVSGLVYAERFVAHRVDGLFSKSSKNIKPNWLPAGHLVGVGLIVGGMYYMLQKTYNNIEQSAEDVEAGFSKKPTSKSVSGGAGSLVPWKTLSIQGRRHVATALTSTQIKSVMGEPATQPIRIFVGLDSAPTEEERVELALAELERTKAYEKERILVVAPTGTGYVNYVMSEALEYQTRGNVASVTLQYSKRPSPMSLDRVGEGHMQYRMLLNGINKRIQKMPAKKRPKIILFGESLGAWTSQDAFMHTGTDGLKALNIDRALWIGTPKGSKWKEQVLSGKMLNTDQEHIGAFDNFEELDALSVAEQKALRYVMVTHYNDPIAQFGLEMLVKEPEWVADESKRPEGVDETTVYRSPTLFVQTLIDMKNALKPEPGKFVASAHDYRGDLARFVAFSYGLKVSQEQMDKIETALRQNEIKRTKRIEETA